MNDVEVSFPGGGRVDATAGAFVIHTDQPSEPGAAVTAPAAFDVFCASIAACAGTYVLAFFRARSLSTEGLALRQHIELDPATKLPRTVRIELQLPATFPEKYRAAVVRAAEGCKVKKTIACAPTFEIIALPHEEPVSAQASG